MPIYILYALAITEGSHFNSIHSIKFSLGPYLIKGSPVHVALACAKSGEGSDIQIWLVHNASYMDTGGDFVLDIWLVHNASYMDTGGDFVLDIWLVHNAS
jgi:hypothetical protein